MSDTPSRVERLLNLLALLLDTRVPRTRAELVAEVAGYPSNTAASRRAFERDKETLRAMGVPIRVEPVPATDPPESGYRVDRDEYALPDLGLDPEETAALHVAVQAVALGNAGSGALLKLGTAAPRLDAAPLASLPLLPELPALFDAHRQRAVASFRYRGEERRVEPWGLVARRGHWYLTGHDHGRDALRTFRVDRVDGPVDVGSPDAFAVPDDFRPEAVVDRAPWELGEGDPVAVRVRVDAAAAEAVVAELDEACVVERDDEGIVVELAVVDPAALRTWVLGLLDHAEVLEPPAVRAELAGWLRATAEHDA